VASLLSHPDVVRNDPGLLWKRGLSAEVPDAAWPTELAARESNGLRVRLFWWRPTDYVTVTVDDSTNGESFELVVEQHEQALDVFHHPYAHAAAKGIGYAAPARAWQLETDV